MKGAQRGDCGAFERDSQNILVVAEARSHLLLGFEASLKELSYGLISLPADVDALADSKEDFCGMLLHAEEKLLERQEALLYIKDRLVECNIPAFLLGSPKDIESVKAIIPAHLFHYDFVRPIHIHVSFLAEQIQSRIRQHSVKKKILVVDDSGVWLRNVKGWLEDRYSVFLANSGAMAIKYLALNRPDLVLLDYAMPVVDGKQVLEMIRSEPEFSTIPVMFLTIKNDTLSIIKVKELRPEGYLLKSMPPAEIVKAVDDFFELQKGLV